MSSLLSFGKPHCVFKDQDFEQLFSGASCYRSVTSSFRLNNQYIWRSADSTVILQIRSLSMIKYMCFVLFFALCIFLSLLFRHHISSKAYQNNTADSLFSYIYLSLFMLAHLFHSVSHTLHTQSTPNLKPINGNDPSTNRKCFIHELTNMLFMFCISCMKFTSNATSLPQLLTSEI